MSKINWNEENTNALLDAVRGVEGVITQEAVAEIAEAMGGSARSVGAKLRKLDFEVEKVSAKPSIWTAELEAKLVDQLNAHPGELTYAELTQVLFPGTGINNKQVQGKVLSLELTDAVKAAPKRESTRSYTEAQEAKFIEMAEAGASLEDIAEALGVSKNSARGKGMSLVRENKLAEQPKQVVSTATASKDVFEGLDLASMTVEQIAAETGRAERGIKSTLTRRGLDAADYKGSERRAKADEAKAAE